jgi:hypothetical protein
MLSVEEALAGHPVGVTDIVAIMDNATSVLNAQSFAENPDAFRQLDGTRRN